MHCINRNIKVNIQTLQMELSSKVCNIPSAKLSTFFKELVSYPWCGWGPSGGLLTSCAWRAGSETYLLACWEHGNCPGTSASNPPLTRCLGRWLRRRDAEWKWQACHEALNWKPSRKEWLTLQIERKHTNNKNIESHEPKTAWFISFYIFFSER